MNRRAAIVILSVMIFTFVTASYRFLSLPSINLGQRVVVSYLDEDKNIVATQYDLVAGSTKLYQEPGNEAVFLKVQFKDINLLEALSSIIVGTFYDKRCFNSKIVEFENDGSAVINVEGIPNKTIQKIIRAINSKPR